MNKAGIFLIFIINIFFSNIATSSENIYFIDMTFIMNNSLAGKSIIKQLDKKQKTYTSTFKKTEIDLKKEETKLISQKNILAKKDFDVKVNLFTEKISLYRKKQQETLESFSKKKVEAQNNLTKQIIPILADYSKEKSISLILPKQSIIIGKSELDLTNEIILILDKEIKTVELK